MATVIAEREQDHLAGPACAHCHLPMRLQRSEPPYTATGMTMRLFRCQRCGLLDMQRLRARR